MGSSHSMECDVFFSMEVKAAISWKCYVFNSMEFHGIAGLTFEKCTPADSMEKFQTTVGLTLGGVSVSSISSSKNNDKFCSWCPT